MNKSTNTGGPYIIKIFVKETSISYTVYSAIIEELVYLKFRFGGVQLLLNIGIK